MDPLSIATACLTLVSSITKLSLQIHGFVREVRDARSDLDAVARELQSLKTILEILAEDVKTSTATNVPSGLFPASLGRQISGIVANCGGIVLQIEKCLESCGHGVRGGTGMRGVIRWSLAGKGDMEKLRSSLEAHKSALDIALEMVTLTITRDIKSDTTELRNDTSAIKHDTEQIIEEIARLQSRVQPDEQGAGSSFMLQRYLEDLTSYAGSSYAASVVDKEDLPHAEDFTCDRDATLSVLAWETDDVPGPPADREDGKLIEQDANERATSEPKANAKARSLGPHELEGNAELRRAGESSLDRAYLDGQLLQITSKTAAEKVRNLLDQGASPNAVRDPPVGDRRCLSAVREAAKFNTTCLKLLLEYGANASRMEFEHDRYNVPVNPNYSIPLVGAAMNLNLESTQLLLETGVSANIEEKEHSPVLQAVPTFRCYREDDRQRLAIVKLLVENGAEVNAVSQEGIHGTALQAYSKAGDVGTVKFLLEQGAGPNTVGGEYGTALHAAIACYRDDVVKLLLRHDADRNLKANCRYQDYPRREGLFRTGTYPVIKTEFLSSIELISTIVPNDWGYSRYKRIKSLLLQD